MKKSLYYFFTLVFVFLALFSFNSHKAQALSGNEFTGWGWSDTLGWISFNCSNTGDCGTSNYKVVYNPTTGSLAGYAWSENVGWIEFGAPSVGKLELNPASPNYGKLSGWARVLSMVGSSDSESSEWADGWISLSGTAATGNTYGITFNMTTGVPPLNSYAWGNNSIGWINFSQARVTPVSVITSTLTLTGTSPTAISTTSTDMVVPSGATISLSSNGTNLVSTGGVASGTDSTNWTGTKTCPTSTAVNYASFVLTNTTSSTITKTYTLTCTSTGSGTIASTFTVSVRPAVAIPTPQIILKVSDQNSNLTIATPLNTATAMLPDTVSPTPGFDQIQIKNGHRVRIEWGADGMYYPSCEGRSTLNDPGWNWSNPSYLAPFAPPSAWGGNSSAVFSSPIETVEEFSVKCKSASAHGPSDPYIKVSITVDALGKFPSLTLYANGQTNQLGHVINILAGDPITMSSTGNNIDRGNPGSANWPGAPTDGVECPMVLSPAVTYGNFTLGTLGPKTYTLSCYTDQGNKISSSVTINIVKVIPPPTPDPLLKIEVVKRIGQNPSAFDLVSPTSPSQNPSINLDSPADVFVRWGADNMDYSTCIARTDPTNNNWEWTNPSYAATTTAMGAQEVLGLTSTAVFHIECKGSTLSSTPGVLYRANVTVNVNSIIVGGGGGISISSGGAALCNGSGAYVEVSAPENQNLPICSLEVTNSGGKPVFTILDKNMPDQHMANLALTLPANNNTNTTEEYTATLTCQGEKPVSTVVSVNYCSPQINWFEGGPSCTVDRSVFLDWDTEKMTSCKILSYDSNMNLFTEDKVNLSVPKNKPYEANLVDKITYFKLNCDDGSDKWLYFGGPIKITNVADLAECKNIQSSVKAPIYKEI